MPASSARSFVTADIDDPLAMRHASAQCLSLALMDARNRSLAWLTAFEAVAPAAVSALNLAAFDPPAWWVGQAAWFQEYWTSRFPQRGRGAAADPSGVRLRSIDPLVDAWFAPLALSHRERWAHRTAFTSGLREYLGATLDTTLELLEKTEDSDAGLYFFRLALLHEDRISETLTAMARAMPAGQGAGVRVGMGVAAEQAAGQEVIALSVPVAPARVRREPLGFGPSKAWLGTVAEAWRASAGLVPDNELPGFEVEVPDFSIDAQAVCWAEYAEFAVDGGYDEPKWWSAEGWQWVMDQGRRAPRHVEQLAGGVLVRSQGRMQQVPSGQSVLHVSWYEADAWCRWAGRRLPAEPEWALAVAQSQARGFVWGDGFEWVSGTARAWPGQLEGPARLDAVPLPAGWRVLRGASVATVPRLRHPGGRRFAAPDKDAMFCAFRSCAL